jgi:hypothetical protein
MAILSANSWQQFPSGANETQFDQQAEWDATASADIRMTSGPFGGKVWGAETNSQYLRCDGQWALSSIGFMAWHREQYDPPRGATRWLALFYEGTIASNTLHVGISIDGTGRLRVYRSTTNLLATSDDILPYGRWNHLGFEVVVADGTSGSVLIELNGNEFLNVTGVDTRNGAASGVVDIIALEGEWNENYLWGQPAVFSLTGDAPTSLPGMHRVHMIKPDGETSGQFTPLGAGTNDAEVDEPDWDDDTSYNESSTVTNKDELTVESLPTEVATVYAVQAKLRAKDPDGTATESVKVGLNSGTESLSSAQALTTGYLMYDGPMETVDPNTASAWTEANVNATDVVYEHARPDRPHWWW